MMAIVTIVAILFWDRTDMLTCGLAEPYRSPSTMVKEGGVPANFLQLCGNLVASLPIPT
jgi:hypothetical protein